MTVASTVHSSFSYFFRSIHASGYGKMKVDVRVVPNAKAFRLEESEKGFRVYVDAKAEGNRANIALQKGLKKLLGREVRLVSGAKSRDKVLEIEGTEKEALDALRKACSGKGAR